MEQDEQLKEAEGQLTGQLQTEFDTLYSESYRIAQELEIDESFPWEIRRQEQQIARYAKHQKFSFLSKLPLKKTKILSVPFSATF